MGRGFEVVSTDDARWDLHAVVSQVRRLAEKGPLYVSVDVSVLDPAYAPGTGFPVPGGLSTWELQQILRALGLSVSPTWARKKTARALKALDEIWVPLISQT